MIDRDVFAMSPEEIGAKGEDGHLNFTEVGGIEITGEREMECIRCHRLHTNAAPDDDPTARLAVGAEIWLTKGLHIHLCTHCLGSLETAIRRVREIGMIDPMSEEEQELYAGRPEKTFKYVGETRRPRLVP